MTKLYKHMKLEHALSLVKLGAVQIGTLWDYRDQERHVAGIADPKEGIVEFEDSYEAATLTTGKQERLISGIIKMGPEATASIHGIKFMYQQSVENFYVFSMSYSKEKLNDPNLMNPAYDACLEIIDPAKAFQSLSKYLPNCAEFLGIFQCKYSSKPYERTIRNLEDHDRPHDFDHPPFAIKSNRFCPQREARAVWRCTLGDVSPVRTLCSSLVGYFALVEPSGKI